MSIQNERPLSALCCNKTLGSADQAQQIVVLLKQGADIAEVDKNGVSPLHHAVRFRRPAAVRALLDHGADVNLACKRSRSTLLHRAVTSTGAPGTSGKKDEQIEIIQLLIARGADPTIENRSGKTPIDYARASAILQLLTGEEVV